MQVIKTAEGGEEKDEGVGGWSSEGKVQLSIVRRKSEGALDEYKRDQVPAAGRRAKDPGLRVLVDDHPVSMCHDENPGLIYHHRHQLTCSRALTEHALRPSMR